MHRITFHVELLMAPEFWAPVFTDTDLTLVKHVARDHVKRGVELDEVRVTRTESTLVCTGLELF